MSMRRHHPVPVSKMVKTRYAGHHTICQFLRDIYAMTNNEDIKLKCRIGMSMTKSMHEKLKYYKKTYGEIEKKKGERN